MPHPTRLRWHNPANGLNLPQMNSQWAPRWSSSLVGRPVRFVPMSSYLSGFRISEAAELLYRRVLRSTTTDVAAHARELGWTRAETMSALQSLIATRLVRLTSDGQVLVEDPRLALERLVDGEEARLEARRRALAETRGAIHQFTAEHRLGRGDVVNGVRRTAWEVVTADVAPSLVEHLTRSTDRGDPQLRPHRLQRPGRRPGREARHPGGAHGRPGAPRALLLQRPGPPGRA